MIFIPLTCFILWETSQVQFQQLQGTGQYLQEGNLVKLEPQTWLNKEFPLRNYCNIGEKLTNDHWLILLYRTGCSECQKTSPLVAKLAKEMNCPLVVLKMNPQNDSLNFDNVDFITGLLNQKITWFAETPIVLELDNGIVKQILLRNDLKKMLSENRQQPVLFGQN